MLAKFECRLQGMFNDILNVIDCAVMNGSFTAKLEDESYFRTGDTVCAVRVYERYSMLGQNRVSMNITLLGFGDTLYLSAITSGGSQAVFFKINTIGEEAFLSTVTKAVKQYIYT